MEENKIISTWGYVGIVLLLSIPVVGLIIAIVWAVGGCKKINKRNFARAFLILTLIGTIIVMILGFMIKSAISAFSVFDMLSFMPEVTEEVMGTDDLSIMENVLDIEGLERLEGLEGLEGLDSMELLDSLQNLDESDIMGIIEELDEEDINQLMEMFGGMENLQLQ